MATKHYRERLEDALAAYINAQSALAGPPMSTMPVETRSGTLGETDLPVCSVACERAAALVPEVHLYRAEVFVTLRTPLDDTQIAAHTARLAWLELLLRGSAELIAAINTLGEDVTAQSSAISALSGIDSDDYREDAIALTLTAHDF